MTVSIHSGKKECAVRQTAQAQLGKLPTMSTVSLRALWQSHFGASPPNRVGKDFLILGIAWRIQAKAYGGISSRLRRKISNMTKLLDDRGDIPQPQSPDIKPGTKLIREWHGNIHTVTVLNNGFEWRGETWRSLSAVAREITGARWSGPRFFGLTGKQQARKVMQPVLQGHHNG